MAPADPSQNLESLKKLEQFLTDPRTPFALAAYFFEHHGQGVWISGLTKEEVNAGVDPFDKAVDDTIQGLFKDNDVQAAEGLRMKEWIVFVTDKVFTKKRWFENKAPEPWFLQASPTEKYRKLAAIQAAMYLVQERKVQGPVTIDGIKKLLEQEPFLAAPEVVAGYLLPGEVQADGQQLAELSWPLVTETLKALGIDLPGVTDTVKNNFSSEGMNTMPLTPVPGTDVRGGIDFSQSGLDMQIKRDGNGVVLPVSQQDLENIRIDGLVPVIISVTP
jgi:hypothetical protein